MTEATAANATRDPYIYSYLEPLIYIPLSTVNFILSVFSLTLFLIFRKELRHCLRSLLISLSAFECVMHFCIIMLYAVIRMNREDEHVLTRPVVLVLFIVIRMSMTYRNYIMALLSLSRARILMLMEYSSDQNQQVADSISTKALEAVLAGLLLPSLLLSCAMQMGEANLFLAESPILLKTFRYSFFVVQGIIPIILVIISTGLIIRTLWFRRRRPHFKRSAAALAMAGSAAVAACMNGSGGVVAEDKKAKDPAQSRRERQASLIIIALSISFVVLQAPTDICGFIESLRDDETLRGLTNNDLLNLLVNIPVELDSMTNFIIYTMLMKSFRDVWYMGVRSITKRNSVGTMDYCIVRSPSGLHLHYFDLKDMSGNQQENRITISNGNSHDAARVSLIAPMTTTYCYSTDDSNLL